MKCPNCGAEVREEDKFCGECGKPLRREIEIAPKWKWGSMIASLVLLFISWIFAGPIANSSEELLLPLLIFGFPATIYLMYKERTAKIKYGIAWILFPFLILFFGLDSSEPEATILGFLFFAIPAIVIDVIYVYKTR